MQRDHIFESSSPVVTFSDWIKVRSIAEVNLDDRNLLKQLVVSELSTFKQNCNADQMLHHQQRAEQEGGWKIRSSTFWSTPSARQLVDLVLNFVKESYSQSEVYLSDRWANVMEAGHCSAPHSHSNADIAVVYTLDRGRPHEDLSTPAGAQSAAQDEAGRFGIIDARIRECCPSRPGFPTVEFAPLIRSGVAIAFPAAFIHWVSKFNGPEPRVTLAFNVYFGAKTANFDDSHLINPVDLPREIAVQKGPQH
jgi:hypothetical protein